MLEILPRFRGDASLLKKSGGIRCGADNILARVTTNEYVQGKGAAMQPTIYEALKAKLGREPTNAELKADVRRIIREARLMVKEGRVPKLGRAS